MKFSISKLCAAISAVLISVTSHAQPAAATAIPAAIPTAFPSDDQVRAILEKRIADKKAVGIAVALIAPDGSVRFVSAGSSGQSAQNARTQIDADTIFEIGSITKTFTGTILAQMVAKGEVALDGKIRQYAPPQYQFRDSRSAGDVTLLQLATHTSGLPRLPMSIAFATAMASDFDNPYKNYPLEAMWKFIADEKIDTMKTYRSEYSNLGVGLLGDLLAHKAGLSYAALVKRQIIEPLGMADTAMGDAALSPKAASRLAIGHTDKLKATPYWTFGSMGGAGGLRASTRDMARYIAAQKNGSLEGAAAAQAPRVKVNDNMDVGLCWMTLRRHNDVIVWHNGGTGGFRSFAGFSKKSGLGVVVLSNTAVSVDDIGVHLLNPATALK
jgi:serine-type D-Ala-D-Ala carboxypeptidase/endopeptidase